MLGQRKINREDRLPVAFLKNLRNGQKASRLIFRPGLNVISGASNTGKSYLLQCLDFAMGSGHPPKQITESLGYETVVLEIEDRSGAYHNLERSLSGGDIRHTKTVGKASQKTQILGAKWLRINKVNN